MTRARQTIWSNPMSALWEAALIVVVILTLPVPIAAGADQPATFVGAQACADCHTVQFDAWKGSHHALAMQKATEATVLGDFADAKLEHFGATTSFFRNGDKFMVRTDGPDGALHDYPIAYTFGVYPLQQYLIEFPDGRLQALGVAWDSRPKANGGQRWFHLYPNEPIPHDDILHWNFMCAECHSTDVHKNYDAKTDTFATTFAEISVGCETCHGAGSDHVAWAKAHAHWSAADDKDDMGLLVRFDERKDAGWTVDPKIGN